MQLRSMNGVIYPAREKPVVAIVNSYSMRHAYDLWARGVSQSHHLWGGAELAAAGFTVVYDDTAGSKARFERIWRLFGLTRNVRLQILQWFKHGRVDLVYAPTYSMARCFGILKVLGLFRPRIVAIAHFPLKSNIVDRIALRGISRLLYLSRLAQRSIEENFPATRVKGAYIGWAPDLDFYDRFVMGRKDAPDHQVPENGILLVSAGKDHRDYETLVGGAAKAKGNFRLEIIGPHLERFIPDERVRVISSPNSGNPLSFEELMARYMEAEAILIPLHHMERVGGLTSLLDALALSKPVLCTRNPGIDIDIESIGCGCWLDPGDVDGWARAIDDIVANPDYAREMGVKGRRFAEQYLSLRRFGSILEEAVVASMSN